MSTPTPEPAAKPREAAKANFKYAAATLLLLGFVSWASQFMAASAFGISAYVDWAFRPTGGAVAVIAAIVMWSKCRSWEAWQR